MIDEMCLKYSLVALPCQMHRQDIDDWLSLFLQKVWGQSKANPLKIIIQKRKDAPSQKIEFHGAMIQLTKGFKKPSYNYV